MNKKSEYTKPINDDDKRKLLLKNMHYPTFIVLPLVIFMLGLLVEMWFIVT